MAQDVHMPLALDDIAVPQGRRVINMQAVKKLADSIDKIGLRHPITVRKKGDGYQLVAGLHRMEAFKKLGREHIPAVISGMTAHDARMWEIAENLHRAELTKLERDENVAEWLRLCEEGLSQVAKNPAGGRPGAISAAARELGIDKDDAHRAMKVDSIIPEAKEAAREAGLDDNRSALLEVAKQDPDKQVATVHRIVEAKKPLGDADAMEKQIAALMSAWNRASPEARKEFLSRIDTPIMDRRYANGSN